MTSLLEALAGHAGWAIFVLGVGFLGLFVWTMMLSLRISRVQSRWAELLKGSSGENLERLLYDQLRGRLELIDRVEQAEAHLANLDARMGTAKRRMGIVKFDAFDDVGGRQSFCLALMDERGDGVIVTSLVGRTDCRVYCKSLSGGEAERQLSTEEQQALQAATTAPGARALVP